MDVRDGLAMSDPSRPTPRDELLGGGFPMVLLTGRMLEHWHTNAMTRRATRFNAGQWAPVVRVHPKDLGRVGGGAANR